MEPLFFATPDDMRRWLEANHAQEKELLVGYYKVGTGKPSMTWPETVDQALAFGWIDGVRRRIDDDSYCIRFTPRKKNSTWSVVNIRRVGELTELGLMRPAGLAAFAARQEDNSGIYAFENEHRDLDEELAQRFQENEAAWTFFQAQPASYRKTVQWWVMSAKREATRQSRLDQLIEYSANGKRLTDTWRNGKKDAPAGD